MSRVVEEAIEGYEADCFFHDLDAAYRGLRASPGPWEEERAERALLDQTLSDGLSDK